MAIEIVDLPIENCDCPYLCKSLPGRVVSSWGLKANAFWRLANGHDGAMAVVEPDPYQWMRSQLL